LVQLSLGRSFVFSLMVHILYIEPSKAQYISHSCIQDSSLGIFLLVSKVVIAIVNLCGLVWWCMV